VVGYLGFAGDVDTAIAIRTAMIRNGMAYVQAGGGIGAGSDPVAEDTECLNEAGAVLAAIAAAGTVQLAAGETTAEPAGSLHA
jgi:anthranilate synthase component 1